MGSENKSVGQVPRRGKVNKAALEASKQAKAKAIKDNKTVYK